MQYKTHVVHEVSDRFDARLHHDPEPDEIENIMEAADSGETSELCKLALELEEKNWDIGNAMQTRRNALLGCKWSCVPGDDGPEAEKTAVSFEAALRNAGSLNGLDTFEDLLSDLMGAVIAPFAVSEILWDGSEIAGFRAVEGRHFTCRNSTEPRLVTRDSPQGIPLPPHKFILHAHVRHGGDLCRGGLIRTLAWLHCFQHWPAKDWLAFVERFGMPFVVAKVDRAAYEKEKDMLRRTIRSFGPRGGGVFSKSMEIELLQAASNGEQVYRSILAYMGEAITKVILGQLASSSNSSGLSGGDAQSKVRQDILEADARKLEATIRARIAAPWTAFHFGSKASVPRLRFEVEPPSDLAAAAMLIRTLHESGFEADPAEIGKKFGLTLTRIRNQ